MITTATTTRRNPFRRRKPRPQGQGAKFHSRFTFYRDGVVHSQCAPTVAVTCEICFAKSHPRCPRKRIREQCAFCTSNAASAPDWYPSRAEAQVACLLDEMLSRGEIVAWRRARPVVLLEAVREIKQAAITYTPDFVVTFTNGTRAWEVKGSAFVVADDARLKIKFYRAMAIRNGWPALDVVNAKGELLHV